MGKVNTQMVSCCFFSLKSISAVSRYLWACTGFRAKEFRQLDVMKWIKSAVNWTGSMGTPWPGFLAGLRKRGFLNLQKWMQRKGDWPSLAPWQLKEEKWPPLLARCNKSNAHPSTGREVKGLFHFQELHLLRTPAWGVFGCHCNT